MPDGTAGATDTQRGATIAVGIGTIVIPRIEAIGSQMNNHVVRWLKESDDPRAVAARAMGKRSSSLEVREVVASIRAVRLRGKHRGVPQKSRD